MPEVELMGEEWKQTRDYYVKEIRDGGNGNLADVLETTTPQKLAKEDFIDGLVTSFPSYESELKSLREEIQEMQESGDEAYDWTKYFDHDTEAKNFVPMWLADDIEKDYSFKKIKDSEQLYVYKDGYYQPKGQQVVQEEVERRLGKEYRQRRYKEVLSQIESRSFIQRERFRPPKRKINLENGVYDLDKEQLIAHDPDYFFTHQIPVKYNEDAQCPNIHNFLSDIVETEKEEKTLREIAGFALLPDYPIAKAFMLLGKGSNGKTQYLKLVRKMVGEKNLEDKGLQELEENRFATASLQGKLACVDDDLDSNKLKRTSTFKKLTGGSHIGAEIKYGGQFSFKNYAKLVFACNELPRTEDQSDGFFRRWILVEFPYKFKENPDPDNPDQKKAIPERELMQNITTEEELEGFLWWAIEAVQDVLHNNEFTYAPSTDTARKKWKEYSVPLVRFIEEYVEQGTTYTEAENRASDQSEVTEYDYDYVRKDYLAQVIGDFCEARSHSRPSKKAITRELEKSDFYLNTKGRSRQEPGHDRVPVYSGIRVSHPEPEKCPGVLTYSETFTHACAGARVESSQQSVDTSPPPSFSNTEEKIHQKLLEEGEMAVQDLVEEIDDPEDKVESFIDNMKNEGDVFQTEPGKVKLT